MPRRKKPMIVPLEEVCEYLESKNIVSMGPIQEGGRLELLVRSADASPETPPASIELHDIEGEGLYAEKKEVEAAVRSTRRRHRPHRDRSLSSHTSGIPLEMAFPRIASREAQGHMGADQQSGDWWVRATRCIPDGKGGIRCVTLGDVPVVTLPDGRPGVDADVLEEVLSSELPEDAFFPDDEE